MLVWVEASAFLRNILGLRVGPAVATGGHVLFRIIIIAAGVKYWFLAVCAMMLLFSIPLAFVFVRRVREAAAGAIVSYARAPQIC